MVRVAKWYVGLCAWRVVWYLFFFQAEDGIRDLTVTGVRTCALPILGVPLSRSIHFSSPVLYQGSPTQTSPYITTFPISQNSSDFVPFVLYPASNKTVWVDRKSVV